MLSDTARASDALYAIPPDLPRDEWVRVGMAAQSAGIGFDTFNDWSALAVNYSERGATIRGEASNRVRVLGRERCTKSLLKKAGAWVRTSPSDRPLHAR